MFLPIAAHQPAKNKALPAQAHRPLWPAYVAESLCSVGSIMLSVAIFFWTQKYLGWDLKQNFLLAGGQGAAYAIGALAADKLAARVGRRRALIGIYLVLAVLALLGAITSSTPAVVALLLAYAFVAAANWPMLESLVSSGADSHGISRRISAYNLTWSATNSIAIAISGTIIQGSRGGIFIVAAAVDIGCALALFIGRKIEPAGGIEAPAHAAPEPELVASRRLAMWLARISLPATYIVIYSMMAMMPSLPVMKQLSTANSTLVSSVWMAARALTFGALGLTAWWHTRPRLLLVSAAVMLVAFWGVTIAPSALGASRAVDLLSMIVWQIIVGLAMGIIYAGSLYFGMVLSEGSTEHGGYHEALIGLGSVIGPGAGALVQSVSHADSSGKTPWPAIGAISLLIAGTLAAAGIVAVRMRRRS